MTDELQAAFAAVGHRLQQLAASDPEFRSQLRLIGQWMLDSATPPVPAAEAVVAAMPAPAQAPAAPVPLTLTLTTPDDDEDESTDISYGLATRPQVPLEIDEEDFEELEARLRLKADALHWVVERRNLRMQATPWDDIAARDQALLERATILPDGFLWMLRNSDDDTYEQQEVLAAGCFAAAADVVALLRAMHMEKTPPALVQSILLLAAAAQSALRVAVTPLRSQGDRDQLRLFLWLRQYTVNERVLLPRHMRRDDPADPHQHTTLQLQANQLHDQLQGMRARQRQERKLLGKLRYQTQQLRDGQSTPAALHEAWQRIGSTLAQLYEVGTPPSNREVRDLLLPVLHSLPAELALPSPARLVLGTVATAQGQQEREVGMAEESTGAPATPEDLTQVADMLRGKVITLVGGERRLHAEQALRETFDLSEVLWVEIREGQSYTLAHDAIARDDVAVVLLAIRWASHGMSDIRRYCEQYQKPLVRLPGGYNPSQVAFQILNQAHYRIG